MLSSGEPQLRPRGVIIRTGLDIADHMSHHMRSVWNTRGCELMLISGQAVEVVVDDSHAVGCGDGFSA